MSVVCVKNYKDQIVMCADSIMVRGWTKYPDTDFAKIEEINGMIMGGCGYAKESSLMWHYMRTHKPSKATERDVLQFMIEFSEWKATILGDVSDIANDYILAYEDKVFEISGLFVKEVTDFAAIGAGADYANSALYLGHSPRKAVETACALCCMVSEPIIEKTLMKE